jgi:hypothetical protein
MIGTSKNIWGFDPRTIPGCVVWLDAADTSTLTLSGSNITAWRDKSTFSNNVNSISATAPTYNSTDSSVNFVASSGTFLRGTMSQTYSNSASVFVVASIATQAVLGFPRISLIGSSATANSILIGQQLLVNSNAPSVITYLSTNTNPSGQGTNIMTLVSNVTYGTRQVITNVSTYVGTAFTISTLLNGDAQTTSTSTRTGTFTANSTNIATYNKYSLANTPDTASTGGDSYNGKIFEYLVFNSALTTSQRQQVEGYLANKWGLQTSIPSTHPYRSLRPHLQYFQPNNIAGLSVWFDAADMTTITGSSPVTAWRDKSGNRWNATTLIGTAPTLTTVNGNTAVSFPASSTLTVSNVSFSLVQSRAIFVVYRVLTSGSYISWFSTQASGINNQGGHNNLVLPTGGGGPYLQSFAVGGAVQGMGADPAVNTIGTTALGVMIHSSVSTASNVVTLNGTSYTLTTNTLASGYGSGTVTYYIGNAYPQAYILCEYILYQREFTVAERQQVEAYLAWKWGITSSLPATHLYKTIPTALIIPPVVDSLTSSGNDAFVVKYDSSGTPLWARRIGGTGGDIAQSVSTDSSGNVIVSGYYASSPLNIYAANGTTVSFTLANLGDLTSDAFVVKYDSSGTPLWARIMSGTFQDAANSVTTDSSGNIVVAGYYQSNPLNIYAANGSTVLFTLSNPQTVEDVFVVKYDASGTPLWARRMGGTSFESVNSVSTDSSGNIIVAGTYASTTLNIYAANGSTVSFTLTNSGSNDAFVVKYDLSGTPQWARRMGGTGTDVATSVSIDSSGNIVVSGFSTSNPLNIYAANGSTVSFTLASDSSYAFVVKYDSSGTPLWARRVGGTAGVDQGLSVSTDSSGNIVVVGRYTTNPLNIYAANGTTVSFTLANDGSTDAFIVKYDSSGTPLWATRIGGTGVDRTQSVSTDSSGNIVVAGYYISITLNIYAANGTTVSFTLTNSGSNDAFVVKYNSSGTPLWARRFGGTGSDIAWSVSTDSSQNIVVAGQYASTSLSFY